MTNEPTEPQLSGEATERAPAAQSGLLARAGAHVFREIRDALSGIHPPAAVAIVVATVAMVVSHHHGSTGTFRTAFPGFGKGTLLGDVLPYLYWFGASVAFYFAAPLAAAAATPGIRVRDTGLGLGDKRFGFAATGLVLAVFLPIVFVASRHPAFAGHYPLCSGAKASWQAFVTYELGYAAYFVAWEYVFRGYLLFSLEPVMGRVAAFVQMMPFAIMHFGKPEAETFGSIIAGIVLGLLALRTRSFWYGAFIHIAVAVGMDLMTAGGALGR